MTQSFDKILRARRTEAGLTIEQLAHLAGVTYHTISRIERGKVLKPHPLTIQAIMKALQISLL